MNQSGIYRIDLHENNGLNVMYRPDGRVKSVSTSGDTISLENSDDEIIELNFKIRHKRSDNNKSQYKYSIEWKLLGLNNDNLDIVNDLKKSIYGWIPVIEFYDKTKQLVLNPFRLIESGIDNNVSNHYNITIENVIYGNRAIVYIDEIGYIFEDENDYIFEDDVDYIFE